MWIYGGVPTGVQNTDPLLLLNLASPPVFASVPVGGAPPATQPTLSVSCASSPDGTKFYSLFGSLDSTNPANCSNSVYVYNGSTWNMLNVAQPNPPIDARAGASAVLYSANSNNFIIAYGGSCGTTYFPDVWRLDLTANTWAKDVLNANGVTPPAVSYAAVFAQQNTLFVIGGMTSTGVSSAAYAYDLNNKNWTVVSVGNTSPRFAPASISLLNRAVVFGGASSSNPLTTLDDTLQFVVEGNCLNKNCEACTASGTGCGWCNNNPGPDATGIDYHCIAGATAPYVAKSCSDSSSYTTDVLQCPEPFPSWAIALIVIGAVVLIGIVIFAIMKVRSRDGYEELPSSR